MSKCVDDRLGSSQKSAWFSFIKSLATFKGDLSSLTAPPFLLSPQSMIEYSAFWVEHPALFIAPAYSPSPEIRMLLVLKWFLTTLRQQHNPKDENGRRKKLKPLNPFLGELFIGKWEDAAGTTNLVSEQVSHHPPSTAFHCWNEKHGVRFEGRVAPKVYFSNTVRIERRGYSILHLDKYDEDYLITMPPVHVEGLMTASLQPELSGSSFIRSSSGYTAEISYSCKGWLSGKRNSFTAKIVRDNFSSPLYTAEGRWNDTYTVTNVATKEVETVDASKLKRTELSVAPIEDQHPLESRRAWQHVIAAINKGDIFDIGHEKTKIENHQRALRKREKSEGVEFPRKYFRRVKRDEQAEKLVEGLKEKVQDIVDTEGVWIWDEDMFRRANAKKTTEAKSPTRPRLDSAIRGIPMASCDVIA